MRSFLLTVAVGAVVAFAAPASASVTGFGDRDLPTVEWGLTVGGQDSPADQVDGVAINSNGDVVITGVFFGQVTIGQTTFTSRGQGDIFLASISPEGQVLWARQFGGPGDDNAFDLAADGQGDVVASGWFSNTVDFGGTSLTSAGSQDMFVAKYRSEGTLAWARSFGGTGGDGGNELSVLDNGEIAVSGISAGPFKAGGETFAYGGGSRDAYVLRLGSDGTVRWIKAFNGPGSERIRAMAMNASGEVFVGFQYRGLVSLDGRTVVSAGGWDGALAKLDPDGRGDWLLGAGGTGTDNVRGAAPGPDGSVYASGTFSGSAVVFGEPLEDQGRGDDYLIRVSAAGQPEWTVTLGGPGTGNGGEIRSEAGGVVMSSLIEGALTITNGSRTWPLLPPGLATTTHLTAFSPSGTPRYTFMPEPATGSAGASGGALAVSPDGSSIATALRFRGQMLIGDQLLTTTPTGNSAVAFLKMPEPQSARVAFGRFRPKPFSIRAGRSQKLRITVRSTGSLAADRVRVCLKSSVRKVRKRAIRLPGCRRLGRLPAGSTKTVSLRIRIRRNTTPGRIRLQARLRSDNASNRTTRFALRIRRD